jgi:L-threonylcarbamoyladenylate synthase
VDAAARFLAAGGVVAYPTETVYGLGVDARSSAAIAALLVMKGRDEGRGISLLVENLDAAADLLAEPPGEDARALASRFWPGPLTIVLAASSRVAPQVVGPSGGVGLRCSSDPWAAALVARFGAPVTSTSANASGCEPARSAGDVRSAFPHQASGAAPSLFVLDGGARTSSEVSTVIEFSKGRATLLREGAIRASDLASMIDLAGKNRG